MPRKVKQSYTVWCPGNWPWEWFNTCTRDKDGWEYVFSELSETRYGLASSFNGCSEGKRYKWTDWALNVFGSTSYPSGTKLTFDKELTSEGNCGSNNFGETSSTGSLTGSNQESPNLNQGNTPRPRNIADGGVILYQQEEYNTKLTGIESLTLISPSQFFGIGDFNLPVDITHSRTSPFGGPPILLKMPGLPPNTTSSIRVGDLIQVTLYDRIISERNLGKSTMISQNTSKLSDISYDGGNIEDRENGWNNKMVSIKVEPYDPLIWQPH
jgi:hypothetical protein